MDFGVCAAAKIDDVGYAILAEQLGYSHFWVADSQMLWSDCYATLALIADRTTRMQIGTGVAVAGTRRASVTAAALASLNLIAPGRVFCGMGSGHTAMRIEGGRPMSAARFDDYLAELRVLLSGDDFRSERQGVEVLTRHLMPDAGFVSFSPRIPLYVSAFGPKALSAAVRRGDGIITNLPPTSDHVVRYRDRLSRTMKEQGRVLDQEHFPLAVLTAISVLQPGEAPDSPRVRAQCGPMAMAAVHFAYEQWLQFGRRPPGLLSDIWDDYLARMDALPDAERHLVAHMGHNCWVEPSESGFLTAELLEATCIIATPEQMRRRVAELEEAGLNQLVILPSLSEKEAVLRDVAAVCMVPPS
ncbi:MAG: LLM class flavin-dependent oxidoreductase [Acidimicrobiales bacterium]|nr:LLM class flavin-dependent oxidoreductase [Acidimicrobiales bacterium]